MGEVLQFHHTVQARQGEHCSGRHLGKDFIANITDLKFDP